MNKNVLLVTLTSPQQWSQLLNLGIAAQEGHFNGKNGKFVLKSPSYYQTFVMYLSTTVCWKGFRCHGYVRQAGKHIKDLDYIALFINVLNLLTSLYGVKHSPPACQYMSSEVLAGWMNGLRASPCTFSTLDYSTVFSLHLLQAVTVQVSGGEKVSRVRSSPFFSYFYSITISVTSCVYNRVPLCFTGEAV